MFPEVDEISLNALKRYCTGKNHSKVEKFLTDFYDSEALTFIMRKTKTKNVRSLSKFLIRVR